MKRAEPEGLNPYAAPTPPAVPAAEVLPAGTDTAEPLRFTGMLGFREFQQVQALQAGRRRGLVFATLAVVISLEFWLVLRESFSLPELLITSLLVIGSVGIGLPLLTAWLVRRGWNQMKPFLESAEYLCTAEQLQISTPHSVSSYRWTAFCRCRTTDSLVLLYLSPQHMFIIPQRYFTTEADWQRFRELALRKVPLRLRLRPTASD